MNTPKLGLCRRGLTNRRLQSISTQPLDVQFRMHMHVPPCLLPLLEGLSSLRSKHKASGLCKRWGPMHFYRNCIYTLESVLRTVSVCMPNGGCICIPMQGLLAQVHIHAGGQQWHTSCKIDCCGVCHACAVLCPAGQASRQPLLIRRACNQQLLQVATNLSHGG